MSADILCEMEWIAFDGYMTFLNDFGGGPDSYEIRVDIHLNNYLSLLKNVSKGEKLENELQGVRDYLRSHQNMCYDNIWGLFKDLTGTEV